VFAAAVRGLRELIPLAQQDLLDVGLSLHAFGHIRERVRHDPGSRAIEEQAATLRVLLSHEANRL
jgi:hypothetical protein